MKPLWRYSTAVGAVIAASALTIALGELLSPMRLFFFWAAVLITAVVAGVGPAVLSIVLAVIAQVFLVYPPIGSIAVHTPADLVRLALFVVFSGGISLAVGFRRSAEDRAARLAARVRLSELRYRTLVEATAVQQAIWTATPEGRINWSDAWAAITGQSREELENGGGLWFLHPDDAARTWDRWTAAVKTARPYEDEVRVRVKGGGWQWFALRAVPVHVDGQVVEWAGIIADIDAGKRHEQQGDFLSRASETLSSSLDYARTLRTLARLCVPTLADWAAIHLARGGDDYERVAVEHSDPARMNLLETLVRPVRLAPELDPIVQFMRSGRPHLVEHVTDELLDALAPDEQLRAGIRTMGFRSWIIAPMITGGRTLGTLTVVHGDSGRHYSETDLPLLEDVARRAASAIENARLYEAAEAANRTKDEFLATLSHELRTPLTAITGWSQLLQVGRTDEQTTRLAVDTIVRSAQTQAELIDDLLDISRVVAGTLRLSVVSVNLGSIVDDVLIATRPAADARGLMLEREDGEGGILVRADERRLRQIVWNLVSNAVKFSDPGASVHIAVSRHGRNARLEVRDTGRGIEPSFLPHVWDRFRQADSSTSRQYGGLGLGLAVVRHLVELHGGTVSAESAGPGLGSRFVVELPLARPDDGDANVLDAAERGEAPLRGRRVLVVDDDADARVLLTAILRQHGAQVTSASSVDGAMREIEAQAFAAVVSDIAMPGEDGYALARRIRATSTVPMIAVSAIATGLDDRNRAIGEGFDEFIRKPVDPVHLGEVLRQAILNCDKP